MYVEISSGKGGDVCGYQLYGRGCCMWISALGKGVLYVDIRSWEGGGLYVDINPWGRGLL